ncbi:MAG TPA: hypothetical protein VFE30_16675 [Anaeromyxobacteraceae bacterium]|jgi:hypothetical protein|nr:hypothetical protein [Anaeromyxobacteraceae bacterium]
MFSNSRSFRRLALLGALGLAGLTTACDPYVAADTSKPTLLTVLATDTTHPEMVTSVAANAGAAAGNNIVQGTVDPKGTASMTLEDYCTKSGSAATSGDGLNTWYIQVSKVLDGASVTSDVTGASAATTCKAASGIKLTRTVAGVATDVTSAASVCFVPTSPDGGSYLLVYPEGVLVDATGAFVSINPLLPSATYLFTGTVKDHNNNSLPLNITVTAPAVSTAVCP